MTRTPALGTSTSEQELYVLAVYRAHHTRHGRRQTMHWLHTLWTTVLEGMRAVSTWRHNVWPQLPGAQAAHDAAGTTWCEDAAQPAGTTNDHHRLLRSIVRTAIHCMRMSTGTPLRKPRITAPRRLTIESHTCQRCMPFSAYHAWSQSAMQCTNATAGPRGDATAGPTM